MVTTFLFATAEIGVRQERTAWPSTWTVQAPQSAIPQPNLVPVRPISSRSVHSRGVSPGTSTLCRLPLMSSWIIAALLLSSSRHGKRQSVDVPGETPLRSEEHTSELQSLAYLVC